MIGGSSRRSSSLFLSTRRIIKISKNISTGKPIFQENYVNIMQHDPEKEGFSIDVNRFTYWSQEEFDAIFTTKFLNMEPEDLKISTDPFNNVNLQYITRKKKKKEVIVSK